MIPKKLATYFRLCDEAQKRCAKMYYDCNSKTEMRDRQERWAEAYYHKKRQVDILGREICGHEAYYDVVVLMAIYDDTHYHIRVIEPALAAAKKAIIKLNKEDIL